MQFKIEIEWKEAMSLLLMLVGMYQVFKWLVAVWKRCQRGMRPHEKEKEKEQVVYITPGGNCFHTFPDCRGMVRAKKEKRETCKFCTTRAEEEMAAKIAKVRERTGGSRTELEAEMAHTEQRRTRED